MRINYFSIKAGVVGILIAGLLATGGRRYWAAALTVLAVSALGAAFGRKRS